MCNGKSILGALLQGAHKVTLASQGNSGENLEHITENINKKEPFSPAQIIGNYAWQGVQLRQVFFAKEMHTLIEAARMMALALARGNKILLCGNGGSAADAQHLAGEFVNRFLIDRPPLPAIALTTDTSALTAIGNDFGFENIFIKQVQALGNKGDILLGISTSGNSPNIVLAFREAQARGLITVGLTGEGGGDMESVSDLLLSVPHTHTPLIQEVHIAAGHILCQLVDYYLFENVAELGLEECDFAQTHPKKGDAE